MPFWIDWLALNIFINIIQLVVKREESLRVKEDILLNFFHLFW